MRPTSSSTLLAELAVRAHARRATARRPGSSRTRPRSSGASLEQLLEREQAARDALRVVEPVDADEDAAARRRRGSASRARLHRRVAAPRAAERCASMPIGNDADAHLAPVVATRSTVVSRPRTRSSDAAKWRTYDGVWKPIRSAPSRPRRICSRHGSVRNTSDAGNGMWRKNPMRALGQALAQQSAARA